MNNWVKLPSGNFINLDRIAYVSHPRPGTLWIYTGEDENGLPDLKDDDAERLAEYLADRAYVIV